MNTIVYVLALIVYLGIEVECQGAHGFRFKAGIHFYGKINADCEHDNCSDDSPVFDAFMKGLVYFLMFFFGGAILCIFLYGIFLWIKRCTTRPSRSNTILIKQETIEICEPEKSDITIFKSGYWKSRYYQYGKWHGPHQYALSFDSQSMQVTGTGSDDVGVFSINGIYSNETNRLGLLKIYQAGTGNPQENLGHQVTNKLTWNTRSNKFEGEWYIQTIQYHGANAFELTYSERQQFSIEER